MERELKYVITAFVPPRITDNMIREGCIVENVTYDVSTNIPRIYKFYGNTEKSLRSIISKLHLKTID